MVFVWTPVRPYKTQMIQLQLWEFAILRSETVEQVWKLSTKGWPWDQPKGNPSFTRQAGQVGWGRNMHPPEHNASFLQRVEPGKQIEGKRHRRINGQDYWSLSLIRSVSDVVMGQNPGTLGTLKQRLGGCSFQAWSFHRFRSISRCLGGTPLSLQRSSMLSALCGFWSCLCEGEPITADSSNCKSKCFVNVNNPYI